MRFLKRMPIVTAPLVLLSLAGCTGDKVATYEPITDPAQLYMRLALNHTAITLAAVAPYDTLQLVATPRDARDSALANLPAPVFYLANLADTLLVEVSRDGRLTAHQPTTGLGVLVVAELLAPGNVRHADTALVQVTSDPPAAPLDTLWVDVAPSDSTIWSVAPPALISVGDGIGPGGIGTGSSDSLEQFPTYEYLLAAVQYTTPPTPWQLAPRLRAVDAAHNPMPIAVEYRSLDTSVAKVSVPFYGESEPSGKRWVGDLIPVRVGQARLVAQATAYGVTKADTLTVTVTPPTFLSVEIQPTGSLFGVADPTIRTNGVVMWLNTLDRPVDLVFDQPAQVVPAPAAWCDWASVLLNFYFFIPDQSSHCPATAGNLTIPQPAAATQAEIYKTAQLQQFTQAGTYTYHDAQSGASGRIIVVDVVHE